MTQQLGWGGSVIELKKKEEEGKEAVKEEKLAEELKPEEPKREMMFIDIFGNVNRGMVQQVINSLRPSFQPDKVKRLYVSFVSHGGGINSATHINNMMKAWPAPSVAICGSLNASASTLLIAQRDLRLAWVNARFMIHDGYSGADGTVSQMEETLRDYKEVRQDIVQNYMDYIGLTKKEIERILQRDTYFNAYDALNLGTKGLIDGIILKSLGDYKFLIEMRGGIQKTVDLHDDDFISVKDLTVAQVTQPAKPEA